MTMKRPALPHPRQLEAVVAVAEAGSVHAASRRLNIPQPAVSRLVAATEQTLGVALFERSRAGTRVTPAGERVVKQIAFALHSLQNVSEAAKEPEPVVRLGCIPRVMHVLIPHLLSLLDKGDAGFTLTVTVGTSSELLEDLENAKLDFIIARGSVAAGSADFASEDLYSERTVIVCNRRNAEVPKATCSLQQLSKLPWVLPKIGFYSRDLIDALITTAGLPKIVPVIETNSFESSLSVVGETRYIAVVPEFAARRYEELKLVRIVKTRPSLGSSPVMLQYGNGQKQNPAYDPFLAAVKTAARQVRLS